MWRGPVVQARKNAVNAVKGKVFSLHAKLIALAAQSWGNPDENPSLAAAITNAKKQWVPNDNIDRAIKKWTWEDKSAAQIVEIMYEGYGAGWVALVVNTLTDNKNRTVANIRHIFSKMSGNMWESGSVSWMFKRKGLIIINITKHNIDTVEELLMETEAEDYSVEWNFIEIICSAEHLTDIQDFLESSEIVLDVAEIDYIPDTEVDVTDFDNALKVTKMLQAFEEDEDVQWVYANGNISPELQKQVDEFIEKNTFKT